MDQQGIPTAAREPEIPLMQRLFDRPFLLLVLGVAVVGVFYTLWGYLSHIDFFWHPGTTFYRVVTSSTVELSTGIYGIYGQLALTLIAAFLLLAGVAVPLILGPEFIPVVPILQTLGLLFPFEAINLVSSGFVLIPLRLDRELTVISLLTALVTVILIFALGHAFAESGVAWARVLVVGTEATVILELLRRRKILQRIFAS